MNIRESIRNVNNRVDMSTPLIPNLECSGFHCTEFILIDVSLNVLQFVYLINVVTQKEKFILKTSIFLFQIKIK